MKRLLIYKMTAMKAYCKDKQNRYNWIVRFTMLSVLVNAAFAIGKIVIGIYSFSLFLCINGLYNMGVSLAKSIPVRWYSKKNNAIQSGNNSRRQTIKEEYRGLYRMGVVVLAASAVYLVYSIHMMEVMKSSIHYDKITAITIATLTFTEIGIALRGFIVTRKNKKPLFEGIKLISLTTSLISLVLTQTAIMSFSQNGDPAYYCGITGVIFGTVSAGIGIYMIIRGAHFLHKENGIVNEENDTGCVDRISI